MNSEEEDKVKETLKLSRKPITDQGGGKRVVTVIKVYLGWYYLNTIQSKEGVFTLKKRRNLMVYTILAFFIMSFVCTAPVTAPALGENTQTLIFKDVTADNPNAVYIKYIVARGLITGFPDGS